MCIAIFQVRNAIIDAYNLTNTNLYQKILASKRRYETKGLPENEADENAWDDRQQALKMFLQEQEDKINEAIFPEEEEEEEEEDQKEEKKGNNNPFYPRNKQ